MIGADNQGTRQRGGGIGLGNKPPPGIAAFLDDDDFEDEEEEDYDDDDEWEWEEQEEPLNVQQQPRGAALAGACRNFHRASFPHPVPLFDQGAIRGGWIRGVNRERTKHAVENRGAGYCGTCE
jgi:hypothetical protein